MVQLAPRKPCGCAAVTPLGLPQQSWSSCICEPAVWPLCRLDHDLLSRYDYTIQACSESSMNTGSKDLMTTRISPRDSLPSAFTRALGQRIREAREERGFSQKRLADR